MFEIYLKSSRIVWWLFGLEWNTQFLILYCVVVFCATFGKIRATFYINIWSHWYFYWLSLKLLFEQFLSLKRG